MKNQHLLKLVISLLCTGYIAAGADAPIHLHDQREFFVDDYLVSSTHGLEYRLGAPMAAGDVIVFDAPWEGKWSGEYVSIIHDGPVYRMYYRGTNALRAVGDDDLRGQIACYAESTDGIHWRKPYLRLYEVNGSLDNNAILPPLNPYNSGHNFSVLLDDRPGVPSAERFKAVGGVGKGSNEAKKPAGLYRYVSGDGIHWKLYSETPLLEEYALDSLNVLAWVPAEDTYAIYFRPGGTAERTIARTVSKNFMHWSKPSEMSFGGTPRENLYTNATQFYFRAPQLLISMPMRFAPDRRVLSEAQLHHAGINPLMWPGVSDAVIMTSRGGDRYERKFMESFVRPGLEDGNWAARSNMPSVGVVATGPTEMSFYVSRGYGTEKNRLERMTLRLDGFASLRAGYWEGYALTKPVILDGAIFSVNLSTSSVGFLKVTICGEDGREIPGFGETDAQELSGDRIDLPVKWKSGKSVADLTGMTVRIKFTLRDADLYSIDIRTK